MKHMSRPSFLMKHILQSNPLQYRNLLLLLLPSLKHLFLLSQRNLLLPLNQRNLLHLLKHLFPLSQKNLLLLLHLLKHLPLSQRNSPLLTLSQRNLPLLPHSQRNLPLLPLSQRNLPLSQRNLLQSGRAPLSLLSCRNLETSISLHQAFVSIVLRDHLRRWINLLA